MTWFPTSFLCKFKNLFAMTIDLRSDTVTRPSLAMKEFMISSELGDDVWRDDPTVKILEEKAAKMFGHEAAIFCPSGTMTNQIAIKVHTRPLDEVICEVYSHVYQYETAGYSFHSGVGVQLIDAPNHKLTGDLIRQAKRPLYDWLPISKLVVVENTLNKAGGNYYTYAEMKEISDTCRDLNLKVHLDGARIFNAITETKDKTQQIGSLFDSVSICLSKGLGAPIGSLLIGNSELIKEAFRFRKVMGGSMRQVGIIAAAGIYALDNNIDRLKIDHEHARRVAEILSSCDFVKSINPVKTNIIVFETVDEITAEEIIEKLKDKEVWAIALGPNTVRFVFHLDVTVDMIDKLCNVLKGVPKSYN